MKQYIDKYALLAEIERLYKAHSGKYGCDEVGLNLAYLEDFIDTIEVKEVDLEKEIDKFYGMYRKDGQTFSLEDNEECLDWKIDCNPEFKKYFAKYFFELGIYSQLTWKDIRLISEIGEEFMNSEESDNCTDDETYYSAILNKLKQLGRDYKTQRQEIRELNKAKKGE